MRNHKSRGLALLLAVAMVFQFCIFSSQSAWAGSVDAGVTAEDQVQGTSEDQVQEGQVQDEEQPAEQTPADVEAPAEEPAPGDQEGESAPAPADTEATAPEAAPADAEVPAAETPAEQPAAEAAMPKTLTGFADGVYVFATVEDGAFEEDVQMVVKKVSKADTEKVKKAAEKVIEEEICTVKAVDISFVDKDGNEVQPAKPVKIDLRTSSIKADADREVVHIKDNGKAEVMKDVAFGEKKVVFDAEHFSVYAVIEKVVPRLTVEFKNGDTPIETMYVKAEDTADEVETIIHDPGAGDIPAGQVFKGWTTNPEYTAEDTFMTIEQVRADAMARAAALGEEDSSVTYYAAMFKQYNVTYVDVNGVTVGTEVAETPARLTEATYNVNMGYSTDDSHNFEGWRVADGNDKIAGYPGNAETETIDGETVYYYENGKELTISGDVKFSANAPEGHWLIFDENGKGATYNAPQFIKAGETTSSDDLLTMERNGYTFKGWYTGAPATTGGDPTGPEFQFGSPISTTTTIYAKWEANTKADYTVLIWKQNVAGNGYDFKESVTVKNATVGSTPNAVNTTNGRVQGGTYAGETGFHFKSTDQASKTVATEGNTVVNVYWDRNEITINFNTYDYTYTQNNRGDYALVDGVYVRLSNGNTKYYLAYSDGTPVPAGTTVYYVDDWSFFGWGATTDPTSTNTTYYGSLDRNDRLTWTRYDGGNSNRYNRSSSRSWQVYKTMTGLYGSTLADNNYTWPTEYDWYSSHSGGNVAGTRTTFLDAFLPTSTATTVNFYGSAPEGSNHVYFYKQNADGNGYTLANTINTNAGGFHLSDKYNGFKCVAWNSSNNTSNWTKVGELMNQEGDYYYDAKPNQSGYQTADISSNGLHIYFDRLSYNVLFYDGVYVDGDNKPIDEPNRGKLKEVLDLTYGSSLASYNKGGADYYEPAAPAGYVFEGWYIDDACTQPYTFTTMPDGGLTVYAKWRQIQFRVFLHPNAGTDSTLDWGSDTQQMNFRIKYDGQVSTPTGKRTGYEFYGWYTDEACTHAFSQATHIRSGSPYDKTTHFTDPMDKWGNGATSNGDTERFWITEEFNLYAKWSAIVVGADGIGVHYDPNGGTNAPTDSKLYKDNSSVAAGAAPKAPEGKVFDHWVLQTWNGNEYVDTDTTVSAGQTFTALKADAKIVDASTEAVVDPADVVETGHYNYTIQLKAVYKDKEEKTPTHIDWYSNYGSENGGKGTLYHSDTNIKINEAVNIYAPAPTRENYVFKGWTKTRGGTTADFLVWDGANYTTTIDGEQYTVTQVAADEKQPYEDLFAVWQPKLKVKITGNTDTKPYNGNPQSVTGYTVEYKIGDEDWTPTAPEGVSVNLSAGKVAIASGTDASGTPYLMGLTKEDFEVNPGSYGFDPSTDVEVEDGWLEITPVAVTVKADDATKVYDNNPDNAASYTATVTGLIGSDTISYTVSRAAGEDVGEYTITPSGAAKQGNYTVTYETGTFTITPKEVTVTTGGGSKEYDGTALTNSEASITGLVNGETATVTATGSQTEVGSSDNTYELTWGTAKQSNYTVKEDLGKLIVTNHVSQITLTAASGSKTYDGSALTDSTVTPTDLPEGFTVEATATGSQTDAGSSANVVNDGYVIKNAAGEDKTAYFTNVKKVDGTLTVNPAPVTITTGSDSKAYDGSPLTKAEAGITGLVNGETATVTATGTITEVGSTSNTYSISWGTAKKDNYTITENLGTLTITESSAEVVLTAPSDSKTYDGTPLTCNGTGEKKVTASGLPEGFTVEATATGSQTNAGSSANVVNDGYVIKNAAGEDKTSNFKNVKKVDGTLTVNKAPVTITTGSDSKAYDGTPLTKAEAGITGLVNNETATVTATGSQTEVGSSSNTYSIDWGTTNKDNYEVTENLGTLTVTVNASPVILTAPSDSKKYDGTALTCDGTGDKKVTAEGLPAGFTIEATASGSQTDAGKSANVVNDGYVIKNAAGEDKTANFPNVVKILGTLEVTTRTVTLTSATDEKVYDGTALTKNAQTDVTVGGDGFASGEGATYTITGTQTEVGSSPNAFTYALNEGTKAKNYEITTTPGTLTVTPVTDKVTVTITENSGSEKYDGKEKTVTGYTVSIDNDLYTENDFTFNGNDTVKGTDAGTYNMELKPEDFTNTNKNFSNVEFVIVDGTLEIAKRTVTLTSADGEKVYDGQPLTKNAQTDVKVGGDGFVDGEGAAYSITGSQTDVGNSPNAFTYTLKEGTKADNYTISTKEGTLTVTPVTDKVTVTITEHSGSEKYDGSEKTVTGYDVEISNPLYTRDDFTFSGNATISGTNAGSYAMELKSTDFTNTSENFTNVEFVIVDGTLEIAKRTVTLTSATDSKTYDGDPLTNDEVTVDGDGWATGEGASYDVTGSQTEEGSSPNAFTYTLYDNTSADNYEITKDEGTLTVSASSEKVVVTITENGGSEKYDGTEKTVTGYTVSISNPLYTEADFEFKGDATVKGTDAGSYDMKLKASDFTNKSKNFTNVEFVIVDGTLEISKRDVTLTSGSGEKVYDGTALTNDNVSVRGDGFAEGEGATYDVTGSQTEAGSSKNAFTYALNEGTKADNYNISKVEGDLKVTELTDKVTVTITEKSGNEKYDGTEKEVKGYTVSIDNELYTENDFTFSGNDTVKGTDAGTYNMELKPEDFTNTNKNFSNVEFVIVDGTLEIAKRTVTLTSADDEQVYNGQALTNDTVTVSGDGFVTGEGATYDVTGSQTDVGNSPNAFTYMLKEGTKADNYTISTKEGTLTVTPVTDKVTVTITEHSGSEKYDSSEKTVTGYDVEISNPLYTRDDFTFNGDATVKGTDAGSYPMELKAADFTNTSENFTNVEFVIVDGTLEIAKRTVTLTSATDSKKYDGDPLTNDEVTVGGDGWAEGEGASYDVTGSQTEEGTSKNTLTYMLNEGTKAANYDISTVEGTLTVTANDDKVTVTITENSGSEKYDGTEKTVTGYTVSIDNELYTEADFEFKGDATVKGTDAGSYDMELKASDFTNKSKNFSNVEFVIVDGTLEISKRDVTLKSGSGEKVYDGTALTNNNVSVSGDGFAEGEGATYDVTGSQTEVGSSKNAFTYALNEGTKADNYNISKVEGDLKVTELTDKVTVTITENSGSEKYDGKEKTVTGYTVSIDNDLYKETDFTFSGNDTVKGTDAGTYNMELKPEDFTNTNKNFSNVEFVIVDGTLEIAKRTVTLTSADGEKVYDGQPLTKNAQTDVKVGGDGFVDGEGAAYSITGSQTEVGSSPNTFTYTLKEGTKAGNYDITTTPGTLKITELTDKVTVTITENSGTEKYDGTEKTVTGYTVSIDNPLYTEADFTFNGDATVKGTDAGSYDMELKAEDFSNVSKNFSNVEFVIVDGTLEISKRSVTLTSATDSKTYDGKPLTNNEVTVSGDGFATGEGATYNVTGSQTKAGSSPNAFTYELNDGTKAGNYEITTVEGTLTVSASSEKVVVTITENSGSEKYDGTEKTVTGYTVSISNPLYTEADFEFKGDATVKGTDAGSYDMKLKASDFTNKSTDFTKVTFVIVDGTLEISKRAVTLTSGSGEKVYNGTALTNENVSVSGDGFAEGEGATYDVTGSQTEVGSSKNAFTYALNEGTKADNYNISKVEGDLKVTPVTDKVTVTINEHGGRHIYDGEEKTASGYDVSIDNKLYTENDFTFSGNATVKGTDAGSYPMELKAADFTNTSENFSNVEFVIVDDTLVISKRPVTLTSADGEKVYDGKALTKNAQTDITVGADGWVDGEGATYTITGTQTDVGSSPNAFTYTLNDGTKEDNYDIQKTEGTLTVTPVTDKVTVTITEKSGNEKYDGTEKEVKGYTVSIDNELYTENDFTFSGNDTVKGTDAGTYNMELKPEDFTNTSKNFTNVEFVIEHGTLTIDKRSVTLTSATDSKVYDGEPLTNDEITVTGDGWAEGEGASYDVTGSQTEEGSSANAFTYTLNEGTKPDNYTITKTEGTLTVTPVTDKVTVTITEHSGSKMYDGKEETVKGYDVSIDNKLYTENDFTFSGSATVKGTDAGTYDMELKASDFTNKSKNFTNVEFVIVDGKLEISKRAVTLTSADDEQVYNGKALTNGTVTISGDGFADGEGATYDVTGTITDVGETPNAFTYTLNEGTKADNYTITKTEGTLTVTPVTDKVTVTITGNTGKKVYDGKEETVTGYVVSIDNDLYKEADFEFSGKATVKGTDAETYPMGLKASDFTNKSKNFTNVEFVIEDGALTITPAPLTVTTPSGEKVYDGDPLTAEGKLEGLVNNETATFTTTGSQTEVGSSENTYTLVFDGNAKKGNYEIAKEDIGTLTVTEYAGEITVTTTGGTFEYDGQPHGADVAVSTLPKGYKVETAASTATATHVAEGEVKATADRLVIVNASGKDVTDNLNIKKVDGTIEITKAPLVITSASGEKVYDGTPLTKNNLETDLTVETLKNGETIDVALTGSQTEVGTSANTIEIGWAPEDTAIGGQSETDEAMLAATADDDPAADEPGDDAQTTATARKSDYDVTIKEGNLTVTKAQLTVKTGSAEKVYDGKPLTCDEAEITGFAEGETVTIKATGSQTEVGSSTNTYSIDWGDVDPNNYEIVKEDLGTLTVTALAPSKTTPAPRTGDMSNMTLPILGILAALILMVILFVTRKRNKEN